MGGFLSCTSISDPYKGALDYSVTIQPSEEVDRTSVGSVHQMYIVRDVHSLSTSELLEKKDLLGGKDAPNGYTVNNNKEEEINKDVNMNKSNHSDNHSSPWKFWRRLSTRSRNEHKHMGRKEKPELALLEKPEPLQSPADASTPKSPSTPVPSSGPLPDVVEKAPGVPRFNGSAIPPPKPPRLFLFRTPSNTTRHSTDTENETDPTYINSERVAELRANRLNSSMDSSRSESIVVSTENIKAVKAENNNVIEQLSRNDTAQSDLSGGNTAANNSPTVTFQLNTTDASSMNSSCRSIPQSSQYSTVPRKPKIKTPELSSKRPGRRRKSSDRGEMTRQKHIMHSISELFRQRLDPYPLFEQLKRSGILTNIDVQSFLGHHDRKSVCEAMVGLIGDAPPDVLPVFCDVLSSAGNCTEIVEVLQVMREMDRIIHDVPYNRTTESSVLADEKNLNYDIGYLAPDHTLKPLVELERVRASSDKRLSKASSRNSAYSLLEGGDSDSSRSADNGIFPGLIMMSICVTGHSLSGQRAEALANLIKNHNCICELRMGKTQLYGEDIKVIAKALEDNRTVHSLDLRLNSIDHTGAVAVAELLQKTRSLRYLNLSSSGLDFAGIKAIMAATSSNKSLIDLDLSFLEISDECCECLRDTLRANTNLQKIRLRSNNLSWSGCYVITEGLVRNMSLNVFDLSQNTIGDEGVQALAKYLPESCVSEICLENCGITAGGCDALAELVTHCKKLKHLDISNNLLKDAGIFKLATALERTSTLQSLGLNMCGVTNDGFGKLLDVLEKNTSIVHMKLCYNRLGREHDNPSATSENLRYRLRIVTSSKPKLKILLWGNSFDES